MESWAHMIACSRKAPTALLTEFPRPVPLPCHYPGSRLDRLAGLAYELRQQTMPRHDVSADLFLSYHLFKGLHLLGPSLRQGLGPRSAKVRLPCNTKVCTLWGPVGGQKKSGAPTFV